MSLVDLDDKVLELVKNLNKETFIYDFLVVMGMPRTTITRAQNGGRLNLAKNEKDLHIKNKLFYRESEDIFASLSDIEQELEGIKNYPRFVVVTNYNEFIAKDNKTNDTLNIKFDELPIYNSFFLPLQGIEKVDFDKENPADIKAAERFAKIYDVLKRENKYISDNKFNIFLIRLLFMLFAEDTNIMPRSIFTNAIKTMTSEDASDMNDVIKLIFDLLDNWLKEFPYVNGQLFTEPHETIKFSKFSRKLIIEAGERLDWKEINPDIFGSMVQAVASDDSRSHLGMHYTSVTNIMKVIKPLFLDDLNESFEEIISLSDRHEVSKRLDVLHGRITKIKFFDPASGSGNFLIITYKEIRRLETKILQFQIDLIENSDLQEANKKKQVQELVSKVTNDDLLDEFKVANVNLGQFYGIEIDPFAHEVSRLSLWIAEHQMNVELAHEIQGAIKPTLPLQKVGDIRLGNALRIDWNSVVPHNADDEVYVFGNPPYIGKSEMNSSQKKDFEYLFDGNLKNYKSLDYIAGWFYLASEMMITDKFIEAAFVATNSINQGSQVSILWPNVLKFGINIRFAVPSFKWKNSAKKNANVIVSIIGISRKSDFYEKKIFHDYGVENVSNINAYLLGLNNFFVEKIKNNPISNLPKLIVGDRPNDGGGLIFDKEEFNEIVTDFPLIEGVFKKFIGGKEFTNNTFRYILWMDEHTAKKYNENPIIKDRFKKVELDRKARGYGELAKKPWKLQSQRSKDEIGIFIPQATSANRDYLPMGFISKGYAFSDPNFMLYTKKVWILGILSSRIHMTWMRAISGKLKNDYRYSVDLVYNTFPVPELSTQRKNEIETVVMDILDYRDESGKTLAELYNRKTMPEELLELHEKLDGIVDRAYRQTPFKDDQERLGMLLNMYQEMTNNDTKLS